MSETLKPCEIVKGLRFAASAGSNMLQKTDAIDKAIAFIEGLAAPAPEPSDPICRQCASGEPGIPENCSCGQHPAPEPQAADFEDIRREVLAIFHNNKMDADEALAIKIAALVATLVPSAAPEPQAVQQDNRPNVIKIIADAIRSTDTTIPAVTAAVRVYRALKEQGLIK